MTIMYLTGMNFAFLLNTMSCFLKTKENSLFNFQATSHL